MTTEIEDLLTRRERLNRDRMQWNDYFQELAEVLHPTRADFVIQPLAGSKRNLDIFDGTPMVARRGLATAIDALLKPKTARWFNIRTDDEEINESEDAKIWFADTEDRMFAAIYAKDARFVATTGIVDNDLVTFGTADLFVGLNRAGNGLTFKASHLRDVLIDENSDGVIDTHFLTIRLTARQAAQKYGRENLGIETVEALDGPNQDPDRIFEFLQVVLPREDRDGRRLDNRNMPFASIVIDVKSEHKVAESGFVEFPFVVPRWEVTADEVMGRSPGMIALPDSKTLQAMGKTLLVAGQKAVDPPMWFLSDSVLSAVQTYPGGTVTIDSEIARGVGGAPLGVLDMGKNIPLGREMQNDTRGQIEAAFFRNVFRLPIEGPQMTATEILERKDEFAREMGPAFGGLETDYSGRVAELVFGLMSRAGAFREAPRILQGRNVRFQMVSPIQRARKQIEAAGMTRSFELLAPLVQVQPQMMDNFDGDAIARDVPDVFGSPHKWIRPQEQVDAIREQRAAQEQALRTQDALQTGAEVVSKVAR